VRSFSALLLALAVVGCGRRVEKNPVSPDTQLLFAVTDTTGFERLGEPQPGDWLDRFDEPGETFARYVASSPVGATPERSVLAFLPVGPMSDVERETVEKTVRFTGAWFGLKTRILESAPLPAKGYQRRNGPVHQFHTAYFLRTLLPPRLPDDAVCLVAVTLADLYPDRTWNFVFGQASLRERVGVYSLARFFAGFWDEEETAKTRRMALRRSFKLVVHEVGHTFGLVHCIEYACNMNGSNSLEESDDRPLRLCPPCLKKLQWNRGFDVVARYGSLLGFFERNALDGEAAWTRKRVAATRSAK
jgi:archaemetzincin